MDMYPVAINIDNIVQEMEGVEYINVNEYINIDKENNDNLTIEAEDIPKDIKFDTWDEVDSYFDDYGARNGFAISKKSVKAASKGIQRNTKTKKSNCLWHINLTFPEQATQIGVTTFVNQHNHELVPKTQEFSPKYRAFTNEALNEILLMTKYGSLTLTAQRNLLKARFPDLHFQDQDLANQQLKANSNLCEIADRLDSRLKDEERWNQFYKYKQATTTNTSSVAGQDLFPIVTKILDK
uniref:FAR1 domain-containing protein n=1 Tax=Rhizophagus irregularis (strain DAOM 181602 / DAOM 197198 / MUCL 43194) TaxID=747089 RepID=U9SK24_RHIID